MPYRLTIATPEGRDLVVGALRAAADQRTRVARQAAGAVAATKAAGRDVRSSAVKVVALLAEADVLDNLAGELEQLDEVAIVSATEDVPIPDATIEPADDEADDGLSVEAQAAAEAAGLKPYDPDEPEDPLTGATSEDDPTEPEEVLT